MDSNERVSLQRRNAIKVVTLREAIKKLANKLEVCQRDDRLGLLEAQLVLIEMIIALRGYDKHNKV